MLRYGIEMATVAASGGERQAVDEDAPLREGRSPWRLMLVVAVARSAGGEIVWAPGGHGRGQGKLFFYGPAGAVGGMVERYQYLEAQPGRHSRGRNRCAPRAARSRAHMAQLVFSWSGRSLGQRLDARRTQAS